MWSGFETTIWTERGASGDNTSAYEEGDILAVALSTESAWDIESHQKWIPECIYLVGLHTVWKLTNKNYTIQLLLYLTFKLIYGACCKIMKIIKYNYFEFTHTHTHTHQLLPVTPEDSTELPLCLCLSSSTPLSVLIAENCELKQIRSKITCTRARCLCHVTPVYR